jgi:DNA polymerase III subunit epsilon
MFAIIDVETTGTSAKFGRITEIAVFLHDGKKVVDEFVSLVNPECNIPYFITRLTGISNEMVATAPRFCEIARRVVEITDGAAFVAHNASFDYGFIREEFARLGYEYERETLCTVRLSRSLLPGFHSYSLGKLCEVLRISNNSRHRAAGDATATVKLFELLLQRAGEADIRKVIRSKGAKNFLGAQHKELLASLPEETGVYYFYDKDHNLIYIGKSCNIRDRVHSHLINAQSKRAMEMKDRLHSVSFERTGSELVALLKESDEIKAHKPLYNRAQRRSLNAYGLYDTVDENGYLCICIKKNSSREVPAISFNNMTEAKEFLFRLTGQYELCQRLNGLYPGSGACFHYSIKQCRGACTGIEKPESYNIRADEALKSLEFTSSNLIIADRGRDKAERSVVLIENGKYMGYGFVNNDEPVTDIARLHDLLYPAADNREIRRIINDFIRRNRVEKIIRF